MQHIHDNIPYTFVCWADPVVHLLLLKSSMPRPIHWSCLSEKMSWPLTPSRLKSLSHGRSVIINQLSRPITFHDSPNQKRTNENYPCIRFSSYNQCDQIGRFFYTLGNFWKPLQQLICPNLLHSSAIFVKVSKCLILLVKSMLGNFYSIWQFFLVTLRTTYLPI